MVALARLPGPRALCRVLKPSSVVSGPLTTTQSAAPPVEVTAALALKRGSRRHSTAASTTGKYSGLQPAITALIAVCSAVTVRCRAGTLPSTSSGAMSPAASMASTRSGVGGTIGRPSVHPFSKNSSTTSDSSTVSVSVMWFPPARPRSARAA